MQIKRVWGLLLAFFILGCQRVDTAKLRNGDIIFQTSLSSQSLAIQAATHSKYTHMGIIYVKDGSYYVYEAVQPVRLTELNAWIARGKGEHFVVKRLKEADRLLTLQALARMKKIGQEYAGKNYDLYFEWSDGRIYCSELVWKIYKRALGVEIGKTQRMGDFDLSNPIVKQKLKERYGERIPLNGKVISPEQMFNSELLETVLAK